MTATRRATSATTPRSCVTRMAAAPVAAWRLASSASTCACTVTSRAVVGSSAMISFGCPDIAMAMTARWRMPPENWCGYCATRVSGAAISTSRKACTARDRALPAATRPRATCPSTICRPTGSTGLSVVVGSWKTKPTSRPRSVLSVSASAETTSVPTRRIDPVTCALSGNRPAMARHATLLPEPDSPTMPSTSPGYTSNEMPRTAGAGRPAPVNVTVRSRTESTGSPLAEVMRGTDMHYWTLRVRRISMLSMSSVKPDRFLAATISPAS